MVKMSAQDNQNGTPDSWDQPEGGGAGDQDPVSQVSKPLSALSLNVNAPVFVPGQNPFAQEFVPSFGKNSSDNEEGDIGEAMESETSNNKQETMDQDNNLAEEGTSAVEEKRDGEEEPPPDDWEDKGSEKSSSEASTEDDTGGSGDMEGAMQAAVKPKKKIKKISISETKKDHINIVFIGHVDAGKSTIGGHIMYLTGMVEKRTLEKYEKEAREKNRESWYLSWALDTNQEERDKGKTVEVGRAYFETDTKHFTILDAPGHRSFVPNMIGGASQADLAVLVISARKGEFETGFEGGGQTREHAMLVKTAGVKHLIVLVNKMDDPTVEWDEERYIEIKEKLTPYLKKCGFNPKTDIFYIPVSGLNGANLKTITTEYCSWYKGPPFIEYLDKLPSFERIEGPIRVPIVDRYKDMGTLVLGKVESGVVKRGQILTVMPNRKQVEVMQLFSDEIETEIANPGENVKVKLKNVEEDDVSPGFVLCSPDNLCNTGSIFDAQIVILEHKSIICAGYSAILHIHTCAEEVKIKALLCLIDKKTGDKSKTRPRFVKQDQVAIARLEIPGGMICLEPFKEFPPLGRFTLRDEGRTIAIGKVLKVFNN